MFLYRKILNTSPWASFLFKALVWAMRGRVLIDSFVHQGGRLFYINGISYIQDISRISILSLVKFFLRWCYEIAKRCKYKISLTVLTSLERSAFTWNCVRTKRLEF